MTAIRQLPRLRRTQAGIANTASRLNLLFCFWRGKVKKFAQWGPKQAHFQKIKERYAANAVALNRHHTGKLPCLPPESSSSGFRFGKTSRGFPTNQLWLEDTMTMAMTWICRSCKITLSRQHESCPKCRAPMPRSRAWMLWTALGASAFAAYALL